MKVFRKDIFVTALLIVVFIFLAGIFLGSKFDTFRVDRASEMLADSRLDIESYEVQSQFYDSFMSGVCETKQQSFENLARSLAKMGQLLVSLDEMKLIGTDSYEQLRRNYFLTSIRAYLLKKDLITRCGDSGDVILYFYNTEDNDESLKQGYVIDDLVNKFDVNVFSIDANFNDDAIKAVLGYYKIEEIPAVVVNFGKVKQGFASVGELRSML